MCCALRRVYLPLPLSLWLLLGVAWNVLCETPKSAFHSALKALSDVRLSACHDMGTEQIPFAWKLFPMILDPRQTNGRGTHQAGT